MNLKMSFFRNVETHQRHTGHACYITGCTVNRRHDKVAYLQKHMNLLTVPSRSILKKWMSRGTVPIRGLSPQVRLQICKPILMEHMSHCREYLQ